MSKTDVAQIGRMNGLEERLIELENMIIKLTLANHAGDVGAQDFLKKWVDEHLRAKKLQKEADEQNNG